MVDYRNAFSTEEKLMGIISKSKKLNKYKFVLHKTDKYGVDVEATAPGLEEFAIEIESTQDTNNKWPPDAPYPVNWKMFTVPARKKKFFKRHPMSLFVKVNPSMTRAAVVPMSHAFAWESKEIDNENSSHFNNNNFHYSEDSHYPALCFCPIEDLPDVIDGHFKHMVQLKRVNTKYTDKRPVLGNKKGNK